MQVSDSVPRAHVWKLLLHYLQLILKSRVRTEVDFRGCICFVSLTCGDSSNIDDLDC